MNTSKFWITPAIMLLVSSCASLPISENELTGSIAINNEFAAADDSQSMSAENGWLDELDLEALSAFVLEVMDNNPNYREVALRMQAAGYNADVAAGRLLPGVGASASASRTDFFISKTV
jgi:outer membrane protein TolC